MLKALDQPLLIITLSFIVLGFFAFASASLGLISAGSSPLSILTRQAVLGLGVGTFLFFALSFIPYQLWKKLAVPIFILSFALTYLVFVPGVGFSHGGATRWISVGPIFFQPGEFLKIGFLIYLAAWLSSRKKQIKSVQFGLIPFAIMISLIGLVFIMQPDVGTLGVIIISSLALFFIAGGKSAQIGILGALGISALVILIIFKPYILTRFQVFLDPSYDPQGAGYQIRQALIALGSGGIWGRGFGKSLQKFSYLPEPTGDSIFAVIGEEFGFIGTSGLVGIFLLFLWRGAITARASKNNFAKLLASGITTIIVIQSFINIAALSGIFPLTGMPLVFISQGSSSLVTSLVAVGILMNIAKQNKRA